MIEVKKFEMARLVLTAILVCVFMLGISISASAKIYKYKDENGKTHFTNDPSKIPEEYREENESAQPIKKEPAAPAKKAPPAAESKKPPRTYAADIQKKVPNLEGAWRGWGGIKLEKQGHEYTGTYNDTYGKDVGRLLLEANDSSGREYSGEWWEGTFRVGELKYKVENDGKTLRGTWCALESSTIKPGSPSCDNPGFFTWSKR